MKVIRVVFLLLIIGAFSGSVVAQETDQVNEKLRFTAVDIKKQKGNFYFYWGYNRTNYAKSDISLKGPNYDFTLSDAKAKDLPKEISAEYLDPTRLTIPQFNFRVGYHINDKYAIAVGWDHMKYQTVNGSKTTISGTIEASASQKYQGTYDNEEVVINHSDFVQMEHSDGFNVLNINVERTDFLWLSQDQKLALGLISGVGAGLAMPWTHSRVFGTENDDRIHFSGLGAHAYAAIQGTFYKRFFLRATLQVGFENMWDIAITPQGDNSAHAEQTIKYLERSVVLGYQFRIF